MKQLFTFFLLSVVFFAFQAPAQVTIDQSNFLRETEYTDSLVYAAPTTLGLPSEGPDQFWDYSSLTAEQLNYASHFTASNSNIPEATSYYHNNLIFAGLTIPNKIYEVVDEDGWRVLGLNSTGITFPIEALTGGPTDSLGFPEVNETYNGENNLLDFPTTYETSWDSDYSRSTPFELTVAAFGLDHVPGFRKRIHHDVREIVGYGQLVIPKADGSPSDPIQVLLMKTVRNTIDSVFLGGAPAPAPLMAAFGLTQGSTNTSSTYFFYKPDFGSAVLFVDLEAPDLYSYRTQAVDNYVAVNERNLQQVKNYPNPISTGQVLTLETEAPLPSGQISITDLNGKLVYQNSTETGFGKKLQIRIPYYFTKGLHFYQIRDNTGELLAVGKVLIE